MTKLFIFIFMFLLLVGTVSATMEWDNVVHYEQKDGIINKVAVIENAFGLPLIGSTIAKIELITPMHNLVIRGEDRRVLIFEVENYGENYKNGINVFDIINMRGGKKENKDYHLEYAIYKDVEVQDYETFCYDGEININGTIDKVCKEKVIGSHIESQIVEWKILERNIIPKGEITIALVTDVEARDYYDGIPDLFGKKIKSWAEWTESLNVDLVHYYKLDEASGSVIDSIGTTNLTSHSIVYGKTGIINKSYDMTGGYLDTSSFTAMSSYTLSFWIKANSFQASTTPFAQILWSDSGFGYINDGYFSIYVGGWTSSNTKTPTGQWTNIVATMNSSTGVSYYMNGVANGTSGNIHSIGVSESFFGSTNAEYQIDADVDEVGFWNRILSSDEIVQLYNEGSGITWTDNFPLTVVQSFPADNFYTTNFTMDFGCNFTGHGENITDVTILVYNNSDNLDYTNTESGLNTKSYNKTWLGNIFDEGTYKWACYGEGDTQSAYAGNRTFAIDVTAPVINITSPNSSSNYGFIGQNISLNWSITEDNLQYCSFDYNNTNSTLNCSEGNYTFVLAENNYNLTFFANDSLGHQTTEYFSWDYSLLRINESFISPVLSGSINPFSITFETFGDPITIAYLNYNGTANLGTISSVGNIYTLFRNMTALVGTTQLNSSFSWNITMQTDFTYLTDPQNQTINPIELTNNCTGRYYIYNITLVDEITQVKINTTAHNSSIKINLRLYNSGRTLNLVNFSSEFLNMNPAAICFGSNLSSGESYSLDTQIQYGGVNYSTELYNIENYMLTAQSLYQNITLYNLETSKTNKFTLIARDSSYLPIKEGLIQIERKYIENGTFFITEIPKTDGRGITSASLQVNDVIYSFYIYQGGVLISSFTEVIAICQNPLVEVCEIDFDDFQTEILIPNYEDGDDFNFTLEYNSTSAIIKSQFLIPSGHPSEIQLIIIRDDALGTSVCTDTITSASGTLSCTIPSSFGNATVLAKLYKDGIEQGKGNVRLNQSSSDIFGVILVALSILVFITLIGLAISDNPIVTAVFIFVGVMLLLAINLIEGKGFIGATAVILFLAIAIIIFIIKAAKRS